MSVHICVCVQICTNISQGITISPLLAVLAINKFIQSSCDTRKARLVYKSIFPGHINYYLRPGMTLTCCVNFWPKITYVDSATMSIKWEQFILPTSVPFKCEVDWGGRIEHMALHDSKNKGVSCYHILEYVFFCCCFLYTLRTKECGW